MATDEVPVEDILELESDQQLHAIGSLPRHRVLKVLRDGPATAAQIAERLGIAKGSSNYHVKVLAKAGLVSVVETRKVRGVTELYYGRTDKVIGVPKSSSGQDVLMRLALADVEAAPSENPRDERLKNLRLSPENYELAVRRIVELHAELKALHDPEQPAADLFTALYRPIDTRKPTDSGISAG